MAAVISKAERQRYIDEYLNASGQNQFNPEAFLDWLEPQTVHPAWGRFFDKTDVAAARAWRVGQVRKFVSDLRTVVNIHIPQVVAQSRSVPAFTSIRTTTSGYVRLDPHDPSMRRTELSRGLSVLKGWHERYGGLAAIHGVPLDAEIGAAIARLETALTVAD